MEKHKERLNFYKNQKLDFKKVLDIGAFEGSWTKMFKEIFPQSKILMIEANSDKEDFLKLVGEYKIALLGLNDDQEVDYFKCTNSIDTGNSIFKENTKYKFSPEKRIVKRLSSLLQTNDHFDLIKMDVQGSELDIIKGGLDIIKNTKFLLLELQTQEYNKGAPRIEEVISFLRDINFEFIDIFDLLYSRNGCLIQLDGFFINKKFSDISIKFN
jgi:FkbM family methyltransferase